MGRAVKLKIDGKNVYVTFNLTAKAAADEESAKNAAYSDTYTDSDGNTRNFGNIVNGEFTGRGDQAYAHAGRFEISLNTALVNEHTTNGFEVEGQNVKLDYKKLVTAAFTHEIGHNLTGVHGDPGGLMDKINTTVRNTQIGSPTVYTHYATVTKDAIKAMIMRIDKPYGTDYAKDADYIEAVRNGQTPQPKEHGTNGTIYTEKKK